MCILGKGVMKTYWLEERENRPKLGHITPQTTLTAPVQPSTIIVSLRRDSLNRRRSNSVFGYSRKPISPPPSEDRRIYSPVMFEDVAMHSISNSPIRSASKTPRGRDSRSNSTGHVFMHSPSELFGALINDTEEFFEDLTHNREKDNSSTNLHSSVSTPAFSPRRIPRAHSSSAAAGKSLLPLPSTAPPTIVDSLSPTKSKPYGPADHQFSDHDYSRPSTSTLVAPAIHHLTKQSNLALAVVNQRSNDSLNKYVAQNQINLR